MGDVRAKEQVQEQDAIFRGTAGGDVSLKDKASVQGTPARLLPAFVLGEELADLADRDPRIVVMTADLASANRTKDFKLRHPGRFFDFGIAEKNMITAAAGMASAGQIPYAATFAAFSGILAAEQIRTDCAYPRMPVRVIGHHSGMSMGFYGTSHHALEDIAMMRTIAELTVVCGRDPEVYPEVPANYRIGKATTLRKGSDLAIIATGTVMRATLDAAAQLAEDAIAVRVIDMHTIKPLDAAAIRKAAAECKAILTVEEHNVTGGLGSAVAEVLVDGGRVPFRKHGIPDEFVPVGPPAALYAHYRLDAAGIAAVARKLLTDSGRKTGKRAPPKRATAKRSSKPRAKRLRR